MMDSTEAYETLACNAIKRASEHSEPHLIAYYIGVAQVDATLALAAATEAQTRMMERKGAHVG